MAEANVDLDGHHLLQDDEVDEVGQSAQVLRLALFSLHTSSSLFVHLRFALVLQLVADAIVDECEALTSQDFLRIVEGLYHLGVGIIELLGKFRVLLNHVLDEVLLGNSLHRSNDRLLQEDLALNRNAFPRLAQSTVHIRYLLDVGGEAVIVHVFVEHVHQECFVRVRHVVVAARVDDQLLSDVLFADLALNLAL